MSPSRRRGHRPAEMNRGSAQRNHAPNRSEALSLGRSPHIACSSENGCAGASRARLFEQRQDGGGQLQVDVRW